MLTKNLEMESEKATLLSEVIRTRRSVFPIQYIDQEIDDEIIDEMLENANWAPSHKLTQPLRFKVLKGEAKGRLADFMAAKYKEEFVGEKFLKKKYQKLKSNPRRAAVIILICMQRDLDHRLPEWEEMAAVATAVQNMWLTSHVYNIGSYWSSPSVISHMNEFLQMNEGEKCLGLFYMGYYKKIQAMPKRDDVLRKVQWIIE